MKITRLNRESEKIDERTKEKKNKNMLYSCTMSLLMLFFVIQDTIEDMDEIKNTKSSWIS